MAFSCSRIYVVLAVLLSALNVMADDLPLEAQLPEWAAAKWHLLSRSKQLALLARINPFVWRGDFNGDQRSDLAILVKNVVSGKEGVAILFRGNSSPVLVGAGEALGEAGDDFSWIDFWWVQDRGSNQKSYYQRSLRLRTDGLLLAKDASASGLIYFKNGKAKWQQQSD
jgi:hypothetical protein